jgi:hypothetical protein
MTPDQLSAIRERLDGGYDPSRLDMALLLDEVERLTKRENELVKAGLDLMVALKTEEAK